MPEPIVESVEVVPSEDGNVTPEAPKVETKETPVIPTEIKEEIKPTEPELYELPDGRKVDANTLSKEWKENFYPEYTRKSQELAKVKTPETQIDTTKTNPLTDPNWTPSSYGELVEIAKRSMKDDIEKETKVQSDARQAIENDVINQLNEIKKTDTGLDENKLFQHATKYGFRDLKQAHQNMKDMSALVKSVQQTTAKNIQKRTDPVSINPGASGAPRLDPSQFANARDYLRSLQT